jgi:hypothetical protein
MNAESRKINFISFSTESYCECDHTVLLAEKNLGKEEP